MKKAIVLLSVLAGIMWGGAGIFVRTLESLGMDGYTVVSTRAIAAVIMILVGIGVSDKSLLRIRLKDLWVFAAGGILGMFGLNLCYNAAIGQLTLSLAAVLLSLSPIFVLLLAAVFFKEKVTKKKILCIIMAIAGCVFASGVLESASGMKWTVPGIIVGGAGAFFYALYSIFSKVAMGKGYHALTITFYCLVMVVIVLFPLTDWTCVGTVIKDGGGRIVAFMILHSLCTSVLPNIFYTVSLHYLEAGKVSILSAGEPAAAMVFGMLFFSEVPTVLSIAGLLLAIVALTLMSMPDQIKPEGGDGN